MPVIVGWSLTALALVALASAAWIRYRFGKIVFEQFILHIPLGGEAGNNSLFGEALTWCILLPLGLVGLALLVRQRQGWRLAGRRRVALHTNAGWTLFDAGRVAEARTRFQSAREAAERWGTPQQVAFADEAIAECDAA